MGRITSNDGGINEETFQQQEKLENYIPAEFYDWYKNGTCGPIPEGLSVQGQYTIGCWHGWHAACRCRQARIDMLTDTLDAVRHFIEKEYRSEATQAEEGEFVSKEARSIWFRICQTLADNFDKNTKIGIDNDSN